MAVLTNKSIASTYVSLLSIGSTSTSTLGASIQSLTDGTGQLSPFAMSTSQIQFNTSTNTFLFPSNRGTINQVLKLSDANGTLAWSNQTNSNQLDTSGTTGTGSITLDSQALALTGTLNEIKTNASAQSISIGFPTTGVFLPNLSTATTQASTDTSTRIATTKYVTDAISAIPAQSGDVTKAGTITANQIAVWNDSTDELRSDETVTVGTDHSITLLQKNTAGTDTENYNIGGGNIANNTFSGATNSNTGFGKNNLNSVTVGKKNVALGYNSLKSLIGGADNVALGYNAMFSAVTASENVAIGKNALYSNLVSIGNIGIGRDTLTSNVGRYNTAIGWQTAASNTSGELNTYLGYLAGAQNATGDQNIGIGREAAYFCLGGNNTSIGSKSLFGVQFQSTGTGNTALGYNSGSAMTTGSKNVLIGSFTGFRAAVSGGLPEYSIITSSNNIVLSDGDGNVRQSFDSNGAATFLSSSSSMLNLVSSDTSIFQKLQNSTQSAFFGLKASGSFVVQTSGSSFSDKLTITSGGNVGIGVVSPSVKLDVGGASNSDSIARFAKTSEGTLLLGGNVGPSNCPFIGSENNFDFAFITNNTEKMRITSGGVVKINTTISTLGVLTVKSNSGANTFYNNLQLMPSDATTGGMFLGSNVANDGIITCGSYYGNAGNHIATATSATTILFSNGSTFIGGDTGLTVGSSFLPSRHLTISSGGNVGIGLASDGSTLFINGDLKTRLESTYQMGLHNKFVSTFITSTVLGRTSANSVSCAELIYDIAGSEAFEIRRNYFQSELKFTRQTTGAIGGAIATDLTISSGGDIFMGGISADPSNTVFGSAFVADSAGRMVLKQSLNRSTVGAIQEYYSTSGAAGQILVTGNTTNFSGTSDYRLKENVTPITNALSRVNKLKPSTFNFIADANLIIDGFLAHEVQQIVPIAVSGEKDAMKDEEFELTPMVEAVLDEEGNVVTEAVEAVMETRSVPDYQGIDQSKIVPLLTAAIQEQQTIIEDLKSRIETLEG